MKMEVASRGVHDEAALFDEDDGDDEIVLGREDKQEDPDDATSKQRLISKAKVKPVFEGLKTSSAGHKIQEIKELMTVPVSHRIRADTDRNLTRILGYCNGGSH